VPLVGVAQGEQALPQLAVLVLSLHALPQAWKPVEQVMPQVVPLQVAEPFDGELHGEHDAPHELVLLFDTQLSPHAWKPLAHEKPHCVPSHVAVPLVGDAGHAVHDEPQVASAEFDTH